LDGASLAACGVSVWDAEFVGSGSCQDLFDLMYSARVLDIPSLTFLTGAEAKVRLSGKNLSDVRRELELDNDLPPDEEEELVTAWAAIMGETREEGVEPDESVLASLSATLHGLHMAAATHGLFDAARTEPGMVEPVTTGSWRRAVWHAVVDEDWKMLEKAPLEVTGDRDLMDDLILQSGGAALEFASSELLSDKKLVRLAVSLNGKMLKVASTKLRVDKDFVMECLALDGAAMVGAADDLRGDREFILEACSSGCGSCLQGVLKTLLEYEEFVLECIEKDPQAYSYVTKDMLDSKDFALKAAQRSGAALQFMAPRFKADREVVEAALAQDVDAVYFAHVSRRADLGANLPTDSEKSLQATRKTNERYYEDLVRTGQYESITSYSGDMYPEISLSQETSDAGTLKRFRDLQKSVFFGSFRATTQAHSAANMLYDRMPAYQRPEKELTACQWGNVGSLIVNRKDYSSADLMDVKLETLMSLDELKRIIYAIVVNYISPVEWLVPGYFGETEPTPSGDNNYMPKVIPSESWGMPMAGKIRPADGTVAVKGAVSGSNPLGGWPMLSAQANCVKEAAAGRWQYGPAPAVVQREAVENLELREGAWVQVTGYPSLIGVNSKKGMVGRVIKLFVGGKAKVKLDSDYAYIKTKDLQVVPAPADAAPPAAVQPGEAASERLERPPSAVTHDAAHDVWAHAMTEYKRDAAEERKLNIEERRAAVKARLEAKKQARKERQSA
jgi:hypothetical protein